jgi:PAS domain S-box-containing protein
MVPPPLTAQTAQRPVAHRLAGELARAALSELPGETVALFDREGRPLPLGGGDDGAEGALAEEVLGRGRDVLGAALAGIASDLRDVPAGGDRLYDVRIAPLRVDGHVAGAVAIARDVTAQRRGERALARSERRCRELIENSGNVVMRADADGRYTFVSRAATRVFGREPEAMLGRPVREFLHPDDHERHARMRDALRAGSTEEILELRVPRPDDTFLWVESRCRPLRDRGGALTGVQTSARDISERRAAEATRVAADEEIRTAFDDAAIGMALVAPDGSWLRVNDALCDIVGYAPAELITRTFQDITHPEDCDADVALAAAVLRGERRTYQMEKRYIRADGTVVWVLLSVSLVRDAAGEPLHFISQIQDISERKRLEAELSRMAPRPASASPASTPSAAARRPCAPPTGRCTRSSATAARPARSRLGTPERSSVAASPRTWGRER